MSFHLAIHLVIDDGCSFFSRIPSGGVSKFLNVVLYLDSQMIMIYASPNTLKTGSKKFYKTKVTIHESRFLNLKEREEFT